jgi:hypothetical protein
MLTGRRIVDPYRRPASRLSRWSVTALGVTMALHLVAGLAVRQPPVTHHWKRMTDDRNGDKAWMDTTSVTSEAGDFRIAWYKTQAAHETKYTVVRYAIDCARFNLSVRQAITYDGSGAVLIDDHTPRAFFPPPFIVSLQTFMHIVCGQPVPH